MTDLTTSLRNNETVRQLLLSVSNILERLEAIETTIASFNPSAITIINTTIASKLPIASIAGFSARDAALNARLVALGV